MVITFVIGATLASFLIMASHQTFTNARSQSWNQSLAVSEAGVEDALQMINRYNYDSAKLHEWVNDAYADSWKFDGNNTYTTVRSIGANPVRASYAVAIDNSDPEAPTVTSAGTLFYDYGFAATPLGIGTAGAQSAGFQRVELTRTVTVQTRRDALWGLAMLVDKQLDFKGNNISTDSFDSSDPNASYWASGATYGTYDPTLNNDNGDIASNSGIIDSVNMGNADIMGSISTGPGGTAEIGPNGSVGSEAWVEGGNTGIESGYSSDDMNVRLTDVGLPIANWFALPVADKTGTEINGVVYQHVITTSGDYKASTLSGSLYVEAGVNARVYFTDSVSLLAKDEIRIDPEARRLTVYMGGSQFKLGGNGVVNDTGNAGAFLYFGLPTNTDIVFGGNGSFVGAIYANHADFTLGGGGSDTYDFIGASVTKTVKMNGHYNFHYDEDLANIGPSRGFIPTSWAER